MPALRPGDTIPRTHNQTRRKQWTRWHRLYQAHYDTANDAAPAYVRSWGRFLAGLMQAQPVRYAPDEAGNPTDGPLSDAQMADLTDDAVKLASGEGEAYVRFVSNGDGWVPITVGAQSVDATFVNNRMQDAVVFTIDQTDQNTAGQRTRLVYTEEYSTDMPGSFKVSVWEAKQTNNGWELVNPVTPVELADDQTEEDVQEHPWVRALRDSDTQTVRPLVPLVWTFEDGKPAPVYAGNEQAVFGLARLWTQEQEDAELKRERIAVSENMVNDHSRFYGADGKTILAEAGLPRGNTILLKQGGSATDPNRGGLEHIQFTDHLTQRDRIERRENTLLESIGISPQSMGRSVSGRSDSAAAKRADAQLTLTTIAGPARRWEAALQVVSDETGRLNNQQAIATVDVTEGLKPNTSELYDQVSTARNAEAMSMRERVRTLHPSWTAEQIDTEVDALMQEFPPTGVLEF